MRRMNFLPRKAFRIFPEWSLIEVSERTQDAFAACAAAVALLAVVGALETQRVARAEADHARSLRQLADVERREADVRTVAQALGSLGAVARSVDDARRFTHKKIALLADVGDALPDGIWMTEMNGAGARLSLKGRARSTQLIGEAMRNLSRDRLVKDPQLVSAREHRDVHMNYIDFEMSVGVDDKG